MPQKTRNQTVLAMLGLYMFAALPAVGQAIHENIKLTAHDSWRSDQFGRSVAISGSTIIIGSHLDDDGGSGSGSAYLYNTVTHTLLHKLVASDDSSFDNFGTSVAISNTTAIVGAPSLEDVWEGSGAAYLFNINTGQQHRKLIASDVAIGDFFGQSVAISGKIALVGASGNSHAGLSSGSAYIFDSITGQQRFKLTASDAEIGDLFGRSVAISGTIAIVGAPGDDDGYRGTGSAYLFDTITGQLLFKLNAADASEFDGFGNFVAISGTTALVGASKDSNEGLYSGSAYLFDTNTGQQLFKLTASDASELDLFGTSVAISETTAIIGAWKDDAAALDSGSAYLFDTTTGQQVLKLTASDAQEGDTFGISVGIWGSSAIVGAHQDDSTSINTGSAYLFVACPADITRDWRVDISDITAFLNAYSAVETVADFTNDGIFNFYDVSMFINSYITDCP